MVTQCCGGMSVRFLTYGVPGQSYYKSTRKVVLQGCDGIVFDPDNDEIRKYYVKFDISGIEPAEELTAARLKINVAQPADFGVRSDLV